MTDMTKEINGLLVHGWDGWYVNGLADVTIWAEDLHGELDFFDIDNDVALEIINGDNKLRKEVRKEYREFLRDKKIVGVSISDPDFECCCGIDRICDFEEMEERVKENEEEYIRCIENVKLMG